MADARSAEAAEYARRAVVRQFFADLRRQIADAIEAGETPVRCITPREVSGNGSFTILDPKHPDHGMFEEFCVWAQGEGLAVDGQYHVLAVGPQQS